MQSGWDGVGGGVKGVAFVKRVISETEIVVFISPVVRADGKRKNSYRLLNPLLNVQLLRRP